MDELKHLHALINLRAMEEANHERDEQGLSHAYSSDAFFELAKSLNIASHEASTNTNKPEQHAASDDKAFREAWASYMEYDQTDWSGLTDEERYISVARHFWQAAQSHERATVQEAYCVVENLLIEFINETGQTYLPAEKFLTAHKQEKDND